MDFIVDNLVFIALFGYIIFAKRRTRTQLEIKVVKILPRKRYWRYTSGLGRGVWKCRKNSNKEFNDNLLPPKCQKLKTQENSEKIGEASRDPWDPKQ